MFEAELDDGFEPVAKSATDKHGTCAIALRVRRGRRYRARVVHGPLELMSPAATVIVVPELEAAVRARSGSTGPRAVLAGALRPRKRFLKVEVERLAADNDWASVAVQQVRLMRGKFEAELALPAPGTYRCRALFDGDAQHAGTSSRWFIVEIAS